MLFHIWKNHLKKKLFGETCPFWLITSCLGRSDRTDLSEYYTDILCRRESICWGVGDGWGWREKTSRLMCSLCDSWNGVEWACVHHALHMPVYMWLTESTWENWLSAAHTPARTQRHHPSTSRHTALGSLVFSDATSYAMTITNPAQRTTQLASVYLN